MLPAEQPGDAALETRPAAATAPRGLQPAAIAGSPRIRFASC
jgi:hypothetical protein